VGSNPAGRATDKKKGAVRRPFGKLLVYATPCFLNQASMRFQPSCAASLR
jgi:hypothetical protein